MSRPRSDSDSLPAKERLENSFWALLHDNDYAKLTVTQIVQHAQVNRNSFYYHFSSLAELADSAIMHEVEQMPNIPNLTTSIEVDMLWRQYATQILSDPIQQLRLDRLSLIPGPHGTPELLDSLRDFMRLNLMSVFHLDPETISAKDELILDFFMGGLLAFIAKWPELHHHITLNDLLDEDVSVLITGLCLSLADRPTGTYWRRIFNAESAHTNRHHRTITSM